ncbi:uncharacterized protein PITG_00198 [Phytophthora infestans T30-4]|uniref:Uncharacterized protein n=1 Tax=Phytophthora infestans (strain T30-4) TaxID=403677 RepID=D0MQ68_PHYIT|nr:uncharacterized protein PITG_00198 [Phytophthora infestans T30-4]EEY57637.1 conserved hypothetical protein [Phytophthora infestans T30-4]|eukprot:XP_002908823.1 conserved hypothetical protein [Phytophthora infestans T30-4]
MLSSDFNCLMAAWFSRTSSRSPSSSRPTWEADVNSASMVDSDTPVCFLHTQWTIAPSIVTTPPVTDFRSPLSAAKSATARSASRAFSRSSAAGACAWSPCAPRS